MLIFRGILGYFIGWRCILVVAVLFLLVIINYIVAKTMIGLRTQLGTISDKRMKLTSEMVQGKSY